MGDWIKGVGVCAIVLLGAAGCGREPGTTAARAGGGEQTGDLPPEAVAEADTIFRTRCVTCHGTHGEGDGPSAASLTPRPRNFRDPEWQADVTDEQIARIVERGGPAVGKSPMMPANPDLAPKPSVIGALVARIRSFGH